MSHRLLLLYRQGTGWICYRHRVNVLFADPHLSQTRQKVLNQVRKAMAAVAEEKLLGADIHRHHHLPIVPFVNQKENVLSPHFILRIAASAIPNIIDAHEDTLLRDGAQELVLEAVAKMTYNYSLGRNPFLLEQGDLFQGKRSEVSGVSPNGNASPLLRTGGSTKYS